MFSSFPGREVQNGAVCLGNKDWHTLRMRLLRQIQELILKRFHYVYNFYGYRNPSPKPNTVKPSVRAHLSITGNKPVRVLFELAPTKNTIRAALSLLHLRDLLKDVSLQRKHLPQNFRGCGACGQTKIRRYILAKNTS
jgi:hypothetical protein